MVYEETVDRFDDGDLAEPKNMDAGKRYVGVVTDVDTTNSEVGNYRTFEKPMKDGRTSIPIITLKLRAKCGVDGAPFDPDENVMQSTKTDFWIGAEDRVGRHSLASLIKRCTALDDETLKGMRVQDAARQLIGAKVTFEVSIREGKSGGSFQQATKVRPASPEEEALVV